MTVLRLIFRYISAYCVVAKESVSKQISIAFLERVKADFKKRYGGGKADTAIAKSLNKEFGYAHFVLNHWGFVGWYLNAWIDKLYIEFN